MVAGCSLVFVLVVLVSTLLIFPSGRAAVEDSESYDKDAQSLDVEAYAQTILAQTEDAGQSYLDETLFVGDSNAVRLYGFGLLKLENYMGKEGMGIEGVWYAMYLDWLCRGILYFWRIRSGKWETKNVI